TSGLDIGVIGVGGLGHMAVQFASRMGNHVTAFTTSPDKAEFATRLGASNAVVIEGDEVPKSMPRPLDILINTVPQHLDWNAYLNLLDSDGVLTFVGVPAGPSNIDVTSLIFKRRRIMASPIGGRGMILQMLDAADRFGVEPIIEKFPLKDANKAIKKVRDNTIRYRAVLTV
ncbi:MAG: zinc-binding dehydrogenase, partial [Planctomycetota bacterium]